MLQVKNLSKKIDDRSILEDVTFSIPPGSVTGLVGRNGVGKSTLMETMIGILDQDAGEVTYNDMNIHNNPAIKQKIVFSPDSTSMLKNYTVKEIVNIYKMIYTTFDEAYFYTLVERFSLPTGKMANYSKGMKALIQILLAFSTRAEVVLLDEPTNGLDPFIKKRVLQFIIEEVSARNVSVLISTHHLDEIEKIADTVVMLKKGKVDSITSLGDMKNDYMKIQVAFEKSFPQKLEALSNVSILETTGRVHIVLIRGNAEETLYKFTKETPLLLDELPMTLEDLFEYNLGGNGHVS
ncbi:ABC transporter ATP-binding protein [Priestia taiwanensis]|uniref:ABC transporter ATP-binding protein n=1 Tax=Priestia taiwanensis TaxID=1347902 RepID=A0A917ELS5_9BACI|nr:ABC transporter ATP-binding protein [Priestia taiwanensis]MBM7361471.1 ABC-2 type transport system ATP-binding protein [Priestia taiwanensis]GGE54433.1 ABC transporter ATP-binding protein [Priestia taiwanensis]